MADYLTDEEQAERLKEWWDRNGTSLIVGLVLAVGAVIGWRYYQSYTADRANAASEAFDGYLEARGLATSTASFLAVLDGDHAGTAYHVFSLFYRARDQAGEEDWEEALALLERAVDVADEGVLRDTARHRAAKVQYELNRLDDAKAMLAGVRSVGLESQVAELSGDIAIAEGDIEAARAAYQRAVDAQKASPAVPGAALVELKLASLVTDES